MTKDIWENGGGGQQGEGQQSRKSEGTDIKQDAEGRAGPGPARGGAEGAGSAAAPLHSQGKGCAVAGLRGPLTRVRGLTQSGSPRPPPPPRPPGGRTPGSGWRGAPRRRRPAGWPA